jgi:hypothetical protein
MGQHGDVVHAGGSQRDRHRHGHQRDPRSTSGNFPFRASADPSAAVSPSWSNFLRVSAIAVLL